MEKKVLITDGNYRHTLAIIRAIHKDYEVHIGSSSPLACGFYSRFTQGRMLYSLTPKLFKDSINQYIQCNDIDVVLPVGIHTFLLCSSLKHQINAIIPVADIEKMLIAISKPEMMKRMSKLGIKTPRILANPSSFPVVMKPESGRGNLRFVNNKLEFEMAKKFYETRGIKYFTSEYIRGRGDHYAYMGLFKNGVPQAFFMQREVRVFPVTGGSTTYAVSAYDKELKLKCEELMKDIAWNGLATMGFKIDLNGELYFLEVNAKFWASLEFSVFCGVNFPLLLLKMVEGEKITQANYSIGVTFRWVLEDWLNFVAKPNIAYFSLSDAIDIHLDDLAAQSIRVLNKLRSIYKAKRKYRNFKLGYPYGIPRV